ncbi:MAG: hypothetical protein IJM08_01700 [Firmicutes bacterium]|nr:hypothetical protein [Bacillota bacterium]
MKREVFFVGLFLGVPLCLLILFAYLTKMIWDRMKEGSLSKGWGIFLQTIFLIPCVFCVFILVFLIGAFTGIIPLM